MSKNYEIKTTDQIGIRVIDKTPVKKHNSKKTKEREIGEWIEYSCKIDNRVTIIDDIGKGTKNIHIKLTDE